jgi:hypothetical protein
VIDRLSRGELRRVVTAKFTANFSVDKQVEVRLETETSINVYSIKTWDA